MAKPNITTPIRSQATVLVTVSVSIQSASSNQATFMKGLQTNSQQKGLKTLIYPTAHKKERGLPHERAAILHHLHKVMPPSPFHSHLHHRSHKHPYPYATCNLDLVAISNIVRTISIIYLRVLFSAIFSIVDMIMICE